MALVGTTFFLVNSNTEVNLLDEDLILLFSSTRDFRNKINSTYQTAKWDDENGFCTVVCENGILEFYFGDEEVIEKFVLVNVSLTDEPFVEVCKLCKKYNWKLFNLNKEEYVNIANIIT